MDRHADAAAHGTGKLIVLVPMGGFGTRFSKAGYTLSKPAIPVIDRHSGRKLPMVIAAMEDIFRIGGPNTRFICIDQAEHASSGLEAEIKRHFVDTLFIHDHARLGQAFACLLAREHLKTDEELMIACCDAGIEVDMGEFRQRRSEADALMLSHSGDQNIESNPLAHSWAELVPGTRRISRISIKTPVSDRPMADHATTGIFWFRRASDFLASLVGTLSGDTGLSRERLVDDVLQHFVAGGAEVSYLDVRYYCWGTPQDYETYHLTYRYWEEYLDANEWLGAGALHHHPLPERGGERRGTGEADPQREDAVPGRLRGHLR